MQAQDQLSTRTCLRRGSLSFVASYLPTPRPQFLASTSLLPLHALYQNTFAPGAWQLLDSDGSLPARSQSRPKPRLSSGLLLASDAPESYFQGSQTKPGHCRLWNALQPELHDFMRLPSFETPVAAPTISHLFESHCHMGLEWLFHWEYLPRHMMYSRKAPLADLDGGHTAAATTASPTHAEGFVSLPRWLTACLTK